MQSLYFAPQTTFADLLTSIWKMEPEIKYFLFQIYFSLRSDQLLHNNNKKLAEVKSLKFINFAPYTLYQKID